MPPVGLTFAGSSTWLIGFFATKYSIELEVDLGTEYLFSIFMLFSMIGTIVVKGWCVETTNKNQDQIEKLIEKRKFNLC